MPLLKSKYKSELSANKLTALLKKIRLASAEKSTRFVIKKGLKIYKGNELDSFAIDETVATATIIFDDGTGAQTYDKADIVKIRRLRTKKYMIVLKDNANPAA